MKTFTAASCAALFTLSGVCAPGVASAQAPAYPAKPILAPAIRSGSCLVMRQIVPGLPMGTVVFAHRPPGPFTQVGTPALPVDAPIPRFLQPLLFFCHG